METDVGKVGLAVAMAKVVVVAKVVGLAVSEGMVEVWVVA